MTNDIRGEVGFDALGQSYTLKFGNGAVRHIENETGMSFAQVGAVLSDPAKATMTVLTVAFHGALRRHHPDLSIDDVDDILDDLGPEKAGKLLGDAVALTYPPAPKGGAKSNPRKATARSTGSR
jgi:hypothetical protein